MIFITDVSDYPGREILPVFEKKDIREPIRIMTDKESSEVVSGSDGLQVEAVKASLYDHPSLDRALTGVDKLIISNLNFLQDNTLGYTNLIRSAQGAGVKYIIFISIFSHAETPSEITAENRRIEKEIKSSGIAYTILRINIPMEYLPFFIGDTIEGDHIYYPGGNGRIGFVSSKDISEVISGLLSDDNSKNKVYTLTHEITYSFEDVADKLSRQKGNKIIYEPIEMSLYEEALSQINLPSYTVERLCSIARAIAGNHFDITDYTLQRLLNRSEDTHNLKSGIKSWFAKKTDAPLAWGQGLVTLSDYLKNTYSN